MAIISCPECQESVSDSAFKCPKCGVQLRKPKRGFMGKLFKWTFIAFNALMAIWLVAGFNKATEGYENLSGAEQAGAAIGTGIGMTMVLVTWVLGAIILGMFVLFTRPKAG
ncbi:hypothetical protein I6F11_06045 [Ensifer sp. NBAIM29]|nr:hypothetical protein [Ensifer sp. NBAIM29]